MVYTSSDFFPVSLPASASDRKHRDGSDQQGCGSCGVRVPACWLLGWAASLSDAREGNDSVRPSATAECQMPNPGCQTRCGFSSRSSCFATGFLQAPACSSPGLGGSADSGGLEAGVPGGASRSRSSATRESLVLVCRPCKRHNHKAYQWLRVDSLQGALPWPQRVPNPGRRGWHTLLAHSAGTLWPKSGAGTLHGGRNAASCIGLWHGWPRGVLPRALSGAQECQPQGAGLALLARIAKGRGAGAFLPKNARRELAFLGARRRMPSGGRSDRPVRPASHSFPSTRTRWITTGVSGTSR